MTSSEQSLSTRLQNDHELTVAFKEYRLHIPEGLPDGERRSLEEYGLRALTAIIREGISKSARSELPEDVLSHRAALIGDRLGDTHYGFRHDLKRLSVQEARTELMTLHPGESHFQSPEYPSVWFRQADQGQGNWETAKDEIQLAEQARTRLRSHGIGVVDHQMFLEESVNTPSRVRDIFGPRPVILVAARKLEDYQSLEKSVNDRDPEALQMADTLQLRQFKLLADTIQNGGPLDIEATSFNQYVYADDMPPTFIDVEAVFLMDVQVWNEEGELNVSAGRYVVDYLERLVEQQIALNHASPEVTMESNRELYILLQSPFFNADKTLQHARGVILASLESGDSKGLKEFFDDASDSGWSMFGS
jgi:hypothetical protein